MAANILNFGCWPCNILVNGCQHLEIRMLAFNWGYTRNTQNTRRRPSGGSPARPRAAGPCLYIWIYLDIFGYIVFGDVTVFFLLEICTKINDPRPYCQWKNSKVEKAEKFKRLNCSKVEQVDKLNICTSMTVWPYTIWLNDFMILGSRSQMLTWLHHRVIVWSCHDMTDLMIKWSYLHI